MLITLTLILHLEDKSRLKLVKVLLFQLLGLVVHYFVINGLGYHIAFLFEDDKGAYTKYQEKCNNLKLDPVHPLNSHRLDLNRLKIFFIKC